MFNLHSYLKLIHDMNLISFISTYRIPIVIENQRPVSRDKHVELDVSYVTLHTFSKVTANFKTATYIITVKRGLETRLSKYLTVNHIISYHGKVGSCQSLCSLCSS